MNKEEEVKAIIIDCSDFWKKKENDKKESVQEENPKESQGDK